MKSSAYLLLAFLLLAATTWAQQPTNGNGGPEPKISDDELRIRGVFDTALPGVEKKNRLKLIIHPHFGDLHRRDYLRVPLGVRYGLTQNWEITGEVEAYFAHGLGYSGGLSYWENVGHVRNCVFEENALYADAADGACDLEVVRGHAEITQNLFRNNASPHHSITYDSDSNHPAYFAGNVIENIVAITTTGTIAVVHGPGQIAYNVFRGNTNLHGGAVYAYSDSRVRIHHNVFDGNISLDAANGSVCIAVSGSQPTLDSNVIRGNSGQTITTFHNGPDTLDARNNWWGHTTGPYHPTLNPEGEGDTVLWDGVRFSPWLLSPPDTVLPASVPEHDEPVPATWELLSVFPNPFNDSFTVSIAGFAAGSFRIDLFDIVGRHIAAIHSGFFSGGTVSFSAPKTMATGIYVLRASDSRSAQFYKVLYLK